MDKLLSGLAGIAVGALIGYAGVNYSPQAQAHAAALKSANTPVANVARVDASANRSRAASPATKIVGYDKTRTTQ